jgi:riboflavin biosynthesis pyrimidine reductase
MTAPKSKLVGLLFETWKDMDRALADLDPEEAVRPLDGGSSIAWTAAHVANQVDAWINVRFQRRAPQALIGESRFRAGGTGAPGDWGDSLRAAGAEVAAFPALDRRVDLLPLLRELAGRGLLSLLVEGGGVILGSFFDRRLVDKVHAVIAPIIIGAEDAPAAVAGQGAYRMEDALRLRDITVERLGDDLLVTGYPIYDGGKE